MANQRQGGGYHPWTAFFRCPDCTRGDISFEHYPDGTLFRCEHCGAEAWAEGIIENDSSSYG